jgi:phosphatidate cytidylyltransferase
MRLGRAWPASQNPARLRLSLQAHGNKSAPQLSATAPVIFANCQLASVVRFGIVPPMSNLAAAAPPPSKARVFFRRLITTVILWTVILAALFSSHPLISNGGFILLMVLLAAAGLAEFYGLAGNCKLFCFKWCGLAGGVLLMVGTFMNATGHLGLHNSPARVNDFETGFLILFVLGLCVRQFLSKSNTTGIVAIGTTLLGLMYVPWLLNFIQKINFFPGVEGRYYVLYFILVTKFSDMGAYVVGSLIGRHKMIPRISPGKTWEGFGGAIVVSTAASVVFAHGFAERMAGMTTVHAVILGVLLSSTAVVGDLIESLFKREAGAKDSGHLFPGIGGILDLLDSLLFNAPIMYLYLRHILTHGVGRLV